MASLKICRSACALCVAAAILAWTSALAADPAWDALVTAAQKEGEVDVHGGPGKLYEDAPTQGFVRTFPGIKVNYFGSSVRLHDLRRTFASIALAAGQGPPMIGRLLGHMQLQTTARYAHLAGDS